MKHVFKIMLWLLLASSAMTSYGQWTPSYSPEGGAKTLTEIRGALVADSALMLPKKKFSVPYFNSTQMIGAMYINIAGDSSVYFYNGVSWVNVLTPSTGVTSINTAYGILGGPITTTGTLRFDSTTVFPNLAATFAAAYGLIYNSGTRTYKADSGTLFPAVLGTLAAGTGISIANRIITNTAPDQTVVLNNGYGITVTGTYPNFTIKVDSGTVFPNVLSTLAAAYGLSYSNRTFKVDSGTIFPAVLSTLAAGTGISISNRTITNTAPDQTVVLTNGYGITVTGTYPNFTITADTGTLFAKYATTEAAGYGLSYNSATRTYKVDTGTTFPAVLSTLAAGYGLIYSSSSRTYKADTGTTFPAFATTMAAGWGASYNGTTRTYKLDSGTVFSNLVGTFAAGYGLIYSSGSRTYKVDTGTTFPAVLGTLVAGTDIAIGARTISVTNISGSGNLAAVNKPTFLGTNQTITASSTAFDGSTGNSFTHTLAASETFTQSNFTTGQYFIIDVKQGSGTTYTITWWSGITWITSGGTAPTQTTASNGITSYGFVCTGTNTFKGYLVATQ